MESSIYTSVAHMKHNASYMGNLNVSSRHIEKCKKKWPSFNNILFNATYPKYYFNLQQGHFTFFFSV